MPDVVILTALEVEYQAVRAHLSDLEEVVHQGTVFEVGTFVYGERSWRVTIAQVGTGNVLAGIVAERAIQRFAPDIALFVGVAGGIKDVGLGDVVVATKVYGYESGKAAAQFLPRPDVGRSNYGLVQRAQVVARAGDWQRRIQSAWEGSASGFVGPIAAGEKVVAATATDLYSFLRTSYNDALAVEMEGRGFLEATYANSDLPALVVRGISDLLDGKSESDEEGWQERASNSAAAFAFEIVASHQPISRQAAGIAKEQARSGICAEHALVRVNGEIADDRISAKSEQGITEIQPNLSQLSTVQASGQAESLGRGSTGKVSPRVWRVPNRPNQLLVGREALLAELTNHLTEPGPPPPVVTLCGLGGVGKTQVATAYAFAHANEIQVIWWIAASDPAVLAEEYRALARALQLPEADAKDPKETIAAVKTWFAQSDEPWLLIFDNAASEDAIRSYLPDLGNGTVIVTSRSPLFSNLGVNLRVEPLTEDQGAEYLRRRTGSQDESADRELASELGGLPLALVQAGAYADVKRVSLRHYLRVYGQNRLRLLEEGRPESDYPETVATTWEVSFRDIEANTPAAAKLLKVCSFLAPDNIPLEIIREQKDVWHPNLATALAGDLDTERIVGELLRFSLIDRIDDQTLAMHRLVQLVSRERLSGSERTEAALATIKLVFQAFPRAGWDDKTWQRCERLFAHALAATGHAEENGIAPDGIAHVYGSVARYLRSQARFQEAEILLKRGIAILESAFREPHVGLGMLLNDLGRVYHDLGRYSDAQICYEQALDLTIQSEGEEDPNTAACHNNLGDLLRDMEDLTSAIPHLERAVAINEAKLKPNDPNLATSLGNLAMALRVQGEFQRAGDLLKRALDIDLAFYGRDSVSVGHDYNNIGQILKDVAFLGRGRESDEQLRAWASQSESAFLSALEIFENLHKESHSDTAIVLKNLGNLYEQHGQFNAACENLKRALAIAEAVYPTDHPFTAQTRENLSSLDCGTLNEPNKRTGSPSATP